MYHKPVPHEVLVAAKKYVDEHQIFHLAMEQAELDRLAARSQSANKKSVRFQPDI